MATEDIERLRYYQRQYLGAQDFEDQQAYHRDMRRRHNLAHHTWGIVTGLELFAKKKASPNGAYDVYVLPGMAVDGYGREVVVFQPFQLDPTLFRVFHNAQYRTIWLEYNEEMAQRPQAGYEQCDTTNQFTRVRETFRLMIDPNEPFHGDITVNGKIVMLPIANPPKPPVPSLDSPVNPYDESVPFQELPDETATAASWLIPLGAVFWDGSSLFTDNPLTHDPVVSTDGRVYVGSVASKIVAPSGELIVRDRHTLVPLDAADPQSPGGVAMIVEGTLEVKRLLQADDLLKAKSDIQVHGGALDFRYADGSVDGKGKDEKLFTFSRVPNSFKDGTDLQIQIGKESKGTNRFVVESAGNALLTIPDDGSLAIGGSLSISQDLTIPNGTLDFGSAARQMIKLWASADNKQQNGIGIYTEGSFSTSYFRSSKDFVWLTGKTHSKDGLAKDEGQLQLQLDENGELHFGSRTHQMLNLWQQGTIGSYIPGGYGIGVQAATLYFRSDSDFCWFQGGAHDDTQSSPGTNGKLRMKLDMTGALNVQGDPAGYIGFTDTTNNLSVKIGLRRGPHGADSIYGSPNLWLDADDTVFIKQGFQSFGGDGAEFFPADEVVEAGDVVVLSASGKRAVKLATQSYDTSVAGIVSTSPAFILRVSSTAGSPNDVPVALIGTVPCKVDADIAPVHIGDLLTTSPTKGHAQKALDPSRTLGAVLGKAMGDLASGQGIIPILVMLG